MLVANENEWQPSSMDYLKYLRADEGLCNLIGEMFAQPRAPAGTARTLVLVSLIGTVYFIRFDSRFFVWYDHSRFLS
jgi:hypothetical protein